MSVYGTNRWSGKPPAKEEQAWAHLLLCLENGQPMVGFYEKHRTVERWTIRYRADEAGTPEEVRYKYAYIGPLTAPPETVARCEELEQHYWALRVDTDESRLETP